MATKTIRITCRTEDSEVRYTINGDAPTKQSTLYTGEFSVTLPATIKARGFRNGYVQSNLAELALSLSALPTPVISVSRVSSSQGRVSISNYASYPSGTKIVINGTSYSMSSSVTISIGTSATSVTAYATYSGSEAYEPQSGSASGTIPAYVPTCATPSISQSGNTITITCSTSGATIYYKIGSGSYRQYTGSFSISSTGYVYAYATRSGYNQSSTASKYCTYTAPKCATPSISFNSSTNTVTITCSTSGATIYYRKGSSGSYSVYSGSFKITSTTTIYAYATRSGYTQSSTTSRSCTYTAPKCATPTISQSGNTVTFKCSTSGATIHYSGCGKSGTCSSGGSVTITQSGTMTAYATASGYSQSSTASKSCTYTQPKCATPVISGSVYHSHTITCSTPGATIYWESRLVNSTGGIMDSGSGPSPQTVPVLMCTPNNCIVAYATAPGYSQSDKAIKEL